MNWPGQSPACAHESDVLDLVLMEQWPARAEPALVAHVERCESCRNVVAAAGAIVELRDGAPRPPVPDASIVWHRAQLRARQDAARRASQPVFAAHIVAVATLAGLGVFWIAGGAVGLGSFWAWLSGLVPSVTSSVAATEVAPGVWTTARWALSALIACAVIALIAFSVARIADDAPGADDHVKT